GATDSAGVPGQVKDERRPVPNTGGIGIFAGFALPLTLGLLALALFDDATLTRLAPGVGPYLEGARWVSSAAWTMLAAAALLHIVGLIDDRRPMGPWVKLVVMSAAATGVVLVTPGTRLLTLLDGYVGGAWLSTL